MISINEEKELKQLEIFTEKEFNKAFNEVWKDIIENAQPNQSIPIGIVTGGLPGSGKSSFILEAQEKLNRNIIAINGDEFRVYHPRFEKIVNLAKGDFPTYTGSFSGKMVEKVIEEAIKQRYNIIVEGTFRTADTPIKTLQSMKDNGYKTIVKIKAVNTEIAWQSTIDRFNEMKNNGLEPRAVNKLIFEKTADSLAALREAKEKGVRTLGIVNVVGSSIAREADSVFYTLAGPEIAVATTKAYSTQLVATYALAIQFAKVREEISEERYVELIREIKTLPEKIEKILKDKERIQWFASKQVNAHDVFFVGRGIDYAICMEGSLKMKEISYIHSEAYAAGELKHGTISLIEDDILVVGVLTQSELYEKTISNMLECKSRGAYLMGLTTFGRYDIEDTVDFTVYIPKTDPLFATSLAVIPLQLLGYYISVAKGLDVDKPRNLAKSVTVE